MEPRAQKPFSGVAIPAEHWEGRSLWVLFDTVVLCSMATLRLEPIWSDVKIGDLVNTLVQPIVLDPLGKRSLVVSAVHKRFLVVDGFLGSGIAFSLLNAQITDVAQGLRVRVSSQYVLAHQTPCYDALNHVTEVCAGFGCMGTGLAACNMQVKASNELRPELSAFQTRQGRPTPVTGNIGDVDTWVRLHHQHPGSTMLVAGFACQPWSKLGDQAKQYDQRSSTLPAVLEAAFFLRCHSLLLECVPEAGKDPYVQSLLAQFCSATNFSRQCTTMQLEHLMPAKRHRWWCLLVTPAFAIAPIRPLPQLPVAPVFQDVWPVVPAWPHDQVAQLALDQYETRMFEECGGLARCMIDSQSPLPTALHGWGNQLMACPCGCRKYAMSDERLRKRGLFGALIPIGGSFQTCMGELPCTRHVHPYELAVVNGLAPSWNWSPLKLGLAGLGQMASPIQCCWAAAHFRQAALSSVGDEAVAPEMALHVHISDVFRVVAVDHPAIAAHPLVQDFQKRVFSCLQASHLTHVGPTKVLGPTEVTRQVQIESERTEVPEAAFPPTEVIESHTVRADLHSAPCTDLPMPPSACVPTIDRSTEVVHSHELFRTEVPEVAVPSPDLFDSSKAPAFPHSDDWTDLPMPPAACVPTADFSTEVVHSLVPPSDADGSAQPEPPLPVPTVACVPIADAHAAEFALQLTPCLHDSHLQSTQIDASPAHADNNLAGVGDVPVLGESGLLPFRLPCCAKTALPHRPKAPNVHDDASLPATLSTTPVPMDAPQDAVGPAGGVIAFKKRPCPNTDVAPDDRPLRHQH